MSIFQHRKPYGDRPLRDSLATLRKTLEQLDAELVETPQIAELKRILAERISEMERKTA